MSFATIDTSVTANDLLARAQTLEQLANLVSYGADKARLRERAGRLRQQAEALPSRSRTTRR